MKNKFKTVYSRIRHIHKKRFQPRDSSVNKEKEFKRTIGDDQHLVENERLMKNCMYYENNSVCNPYYNDAGNPIDWDYSC